MNYVKQINENKREKHVLERYIQLAGLVRKGKMINKDKEFRARQWVIEQEKIEFENKGKQKWWENNLFQILMGLGALSGIIGLFLFF
jgi:hypothetical protein